MYVYGTRVRAYTRVQWAYMGRYRRVAPVGAHSHGTRGRASCHVDVSAQ